MKYAKILGVGLVVASLAAVASETAYAEHPGHGHGPNGGVVFDLGKYHAELTINHGKKEIAVLFLKDIKGKKEKEFPPLPVTATEFILTTRPTKTREGKVIAPMTIKLIAKDAAGGKASKFVGTDPGLGNVADFEGTVIGAIDGKPSQGKFSEE